MIKEIRNMIILIFLLIGFFFLRNHLFDLWKKINCSLSGKQPLTLTNGGVVCMLKHADAGKSCKNSNECLGFCEKTKPDPIYYETEKTIGHYYPERKNWEGKCSEYDLPKACYKKLSKMNKNKTTYTDEVIICPPKTLY